MSKKMKYMADGGIVGADGMTEAQRAKRNAALSSLGMSTAPAPVQPAQAAPLPQAPVQQPPVQTQDRPRGIFGIVGGRQQQIDKAAGYANGGKVGMRSFQYGGTTDGAILDEDGGIAAGIGLIERGRQKQSMAQQDLAQKFAEINGYRNGGLIEGIGTPTSDSIPAKIKETGEPIKVSTKERIVSHEQDKLLQRLAKAMGFASVDAFFEAGTGKPVGPTIKSGKRAAANGGIFDRDPLGALSEAIGKNNAAVDAANASVQKLYPAGTFDQSANANSGSQPASHPPVAQGIASISTLPQASYSNEGRSVPSAVAKPGAGIVVDNEFTQGGKSYTANPTGQQGISRVTSAGTSPLYTNIDPAQGVAGLKNQTVGQPADQEAQGIARIANANKIRGEMIANRDKDIPAGGYAPSILADRSVEDNAALDAMRRSSMISNLSPSQQAEFNMSLSKLALQDKGQNLASDNARYAAEVQDKRAAGHDSVIARGQDLTAQTEAARIAGNPLDQQAKQLSLVQAQKMQQLYDKAAGGDAAAIKELQLRNPKEPNYGNRYTALPNIKRYNDMGQVIGEEPGGMFDNMTGTAVGNQQQTGSQQATAPKAGEVRGGYRFKGGNPADKASWEKA